MHSVLPGVEEVTEAGIIWKDLKPLNIMFVRRGRGPLPVMCDFGSSVLVEADGLEKCAAPGGTAAYKAPELKYRRRVGQACDVWALGCMLLTLRLGREVQLLPDEEPDDAAASWDAAAVLSKYEGELLPLEIRFIADCLAYDPSKRPTVRELDEHEYMETVPASLRQAAAARSAAMGQMLAQYTAAAQEALEAAADSTGAHL
jgi:serine/threonine protein kinase